MASRDLINLGIAPDSGTGDSARRGGAKINTLFADIYAHFGDNPVGNDPTGANYGYRQKFSEHEFKVGELHAAGRYIPIKFKTTSGAPYNAVHGWGVDFLGVPVDSNGNGVPDIYEDSEWFFLARGDSVGLDLSEIDVDGVAHIVLPLAEPGDVIRVRDVSDSWDGRFISIWTTPYEFQNSTQVVEWENATNFTYPDSNSISISWFRNNQIKANFKTAKSPNSGVYPELDQNFTPTSDTIYGNITPVPVGTSPVYLKDKARYEFIFTYIGARYGWSIQANALQSLDVTYEVNRLDYRIDSLDSEISIMQRDADSDANRIYRLRLDADSDGLSIANLYRDMDSDYTVLRQHRLLIDGGKY